jgi:hypothetical protein
MNNKERLDWLKVHGGDLDLSYTRSTYSCGYCHANSVLWPQLFEDHCKDKKTCPVCKEQTVDYYENYADIP